MSSLKEINRKIYIDDELLIDFHKPMLNFSRLPLYQSDSELISLFGVLSTLIYASKVKERFKDQLIYNHYYELIYFLTSKYMISIPGTRTSRTLELGADNWILSYHLCVLLGAFHADNEYFLVTDEKNPDNVLWLKNHIEQEKLLKNVTLINGEYEELSFCDNSFDIVILNGSSNSINPGGMVAAALKSVKKHGLIITFNQFTNTVFEDIYKLRTEHNIHSFKSYTLDDKNAEIIVVET